MSRINLLTISWTLVHLITEDSPFFNFTENDYANLKGEFMVFVKTFDDMFSTVLATTTSYTFDVVIYGAKFDIMYFENDANTKTILQLDKLNSFKKVTFT